jgi:surface protein
VTNMAYSKSFIDQCCFCGNCFVCGWSCWHHVFIYSMHRHLLLPLIVLPAVVCVVFHSNSAFNSDISAWNTGAVTTMGSSKTFIDWCFFCLWQLCCLLL